MRVPRCFACASISCAFATRSGCIDEWPTYPPTSALMTETVSMFASLRLESDRWQRLGCDSEGSYQRAPERVKTADCKYRTAGSCGFAFSAEPAVTIMERAAGPA